MSLPWLFGRARAFEIFDTHLFLFFYSSSSCLFCFVYLLRRPFDIHRGPLETTKTIKGSIEIQKSFIFLFFSLKNPSRLTREIFQQFFYASLKCNCFSLISFFKMKWTTIKKKGGQSWANDSIDVYYIAVC